MNKKGVLSPQAARDSGPHVTLTRLDASSQPDLTTSSNPEANTRQRCEQMLRYFDYGKMTRNAGPQIASEAVYRAPLRLEQRRFPPRQRSIRRLTAFNAGTDQQATLTQIEHIAPTRKRKRKDGPIRNREGESAGGDEILAEAVNHEAMEGGEPLWDDENVMKAKERSRKRVKVAFVDDEKENEQPNARSGKASKSKSRKSNRLQTLSESQSTLTQIEYIRCTPSPFDHSGLGEEKDIQPSPKPKRKHFTSSERLLRQKTITQMDFARSAKVPDAEDETTDHLGYGLVVGIMHSQLPTLGPTEGEVRATASSCSLANQSRTGRIDQCTSLRELKYEPRTQPIPDSEDEGLDDEPKNASASRTRRRWSLSADRYFGAGTISNNVRSSNEDSMCPSVGASAGDSVDTEIESEAGDLPIAKETPVGVNLTTTNIVNGSQACRSGDGPTGAVESPITPTRNRLSRIPSSQTPASDRLSLTASPQKYINSVIASHPEKSPSKSQEIIGFKSLRSSSSTWQESRRSPLKELSQHAEDSYVSPTKKRICEFNARLAALSSLSATTRRVSKRKGDAAFHPVEHKDFSLER